MSQSLLPNGWVAEVDLQMETTEYSKVFTRRFDPEVLGAFEGVEVLICADSRGVWVRSGIRSAIPYEWLLEIQRALSAAAMEHLRWKGVVPA